MERDRTELLIFQAPSNGVEWVEYCQLIAQRLALQAFVAFDMATRLAIKAHESSPPRALVYQSSQSWQYESKYSPTQPPVERETSCLPCASTGQHIDLSSSKMPILHIRSLLRTTQTPRWQSQQRSISSSKDWSQASCRHVSCTFA